MSNVVSWAVKFIYFVLDSVLTDGLWKVVMIMSLNCHAPKIAFLAASLPDVKNERKVLENSAYNLL